MMLKYIRVFPSQEPHEATFAMYYLLVFLLASYTGIFFFCVCDMLDENLIVKKLFVMKMFKHTQLYREFHS